MVQDIRWQQLAKRSWGHSGKLPRQDTTVTYCFSGTALSTGPYRSCAGGGGGQLASLQVLQTLRDKSEARVQAAVLSYKAPGKHHSIAHLRSGNPRTWDLRGPPRWGSCLSTDQLTSPGPCFQPNFACRKGRSRCEV